MWGVNMCNAQTYYRQPHRIPEKSGMEFRTSELIARILSDFGYEPKRIGDTTVYTDLITDISLPWILLRADMDALPVLEKTNLPFSSERSGWMHACGHDTHCAMLLEAAGHLYGKQLRHNIRFVFQSAEETTQGTLVAIQGGIIPDHLVACFAMHVWPGVPAATLATKPDALMASSDVFRIKISGRSSHCAQCYNGADALQTAVRIASKFPKIKACAVNENTLLFCGSIHSGSGHNIVPDEASLHGTLRTFSNRDRENLKQLLWSAVMEASEMFGTQAVLEWEGGCPAVWNSPEIIGILKDRIPDLCDQVQATLAGEDFAYFQQYAPGVMLWLGTGDTPRCITENFCAREDIAQRCIRLVEIGCFDWEKALHKSRDSADA